MHTPSRPHRPNGRSFAHPARCPRRGIGGAMLDGVDSVMKDVVSVVVDADDEVVMKEE